MLNNFPNGSYAKIRANIDAVGDNTKKSGLIGRRDEEPFNDVKVTVSRRIFSLRPLDTNS